MKKSFFLLTCFVAFTFIQAEEIAHFYLNNCGGVESLYEKLLIDHAANSLAQALQGKSKLSQDPIFAADRSCNSVYGVIPYYHLLNNLCSLKGSSHLHVGLYTGGSFVGALYANEELLADKIGIDWFDSDWYKDVCYKVCKKYLKNDGYRIVSADCFALDKSIFKHPVDIYVYDAGHEIIDHEKAFTYYNDVLADVFIAVVDDWSLEQVRQGTFQAFDTLGYKILYQDEIMNHEVVGNGQYLAVIRKK